MADLTRIAKGAVVTFGLTVVGLGLNYLYNILMARWLGPSLFGAYNAGLAVFNIVGLLALLGLDNAVLRYLPVVQPAALGPLARDITVLGILSSVLIGTLTYAGHSWFIAFIDGDNYLNQIIPYFIVAVPAYVTGTIFLSILQSQHRVHLRLVTKYLIEPITKFAVFLGLSFFGYTLVAALLGFIVSNFVTAMLGICGGISLLGSTSVAGSGGASVKKRSILRYCLPLVSGLLLSSIGTRSDVILISHLNSASDAGLYSAANQTAAILVIILVCVESVVAPYISDFIAKGDAPGLKRLYCTSLRWVYLMGLPLFFTFEFYGRQILGIFGDQFLEAQPCFQILAAAQMINLATGSANSILIFSGKSSVIMMNSALEGVLQLWLNMVLIPKYGILGAALGGAAVMAVINILRLMEVYYIFGLHPYRPGLVRPLFLCMGIWYGLELLGDHFERFTGFHRIAIFLLTAAVGVVLAGFEKEDWLMVRSGFQRIAFVRYVRG